jgi:hypothetical protein
MHSAYAMLVHTSNLFSWTELLEFQGDLSADRGVGAPGASSGRTEPTRAHALEVNEEVL